MKVIEVSSLVAGPALGSLLQSLGATVVKVEQPHIGDPSRSVSPWGFENYNYGKKSICLNLKSSEGTSILWKLVSRADIFIENLGPDVSGRLGFSYSHLKKLNPKLVYCSVKGFAKGTREYDKPAFDAIAQALSGMMSLTGEPDGEPLRIGNPSVDLGAASYGAIEILASLLELKKTGKGRFIEISLLDMSVYWNGYWLTYYGMRKRVPRRLGSGHLGYSPHRVFKTRDHQYVFIATLSDAQWSKLVEILKIELPKSFDKMAFRLRNHITVESAVGAKVSKLDSEYIEKIISPYVPCAKVNSIEEVYRDRSLSRRGVLIESELNGRTVKIATPPTVRHFLKKSNYKQRIVASPKLGANTTEILQDIGYTLKEINTLKSKNVV